MLERFFTLHSIPELCSPTRSLSLFTLKVIVIVIVNVIVEQYFNPKPKNFILKFAFIPNFTYLCTQKCPFFGVFTSLFFVITFASMFYIR